MKSSIAALLLLALCASSPLLAQQNKPAVADTSKNLKVVKPARDSVVKRDSAIAGRFGKIYLTTKPDTAEVSLDSVARGNSPCVLDSLKPGDHVLIVKRKGYFGKKVNVVVPADSTIPVDVALVKPATIFVSSVPESSTVKIDGKDAGVTPYENGKVKPGEHVLRIAKDKFVPVDITIVAAEGKTDSLSFSLVAEAPKSVVEPKKPGTKLGLDTTILIVLTGVFAVFGLVIIGVESGSK
jgi:hypothetical protein